MFRRHGRTAIRCPMLLKHRILGELDVITTNISASGVFVGAPSPEQEQLLPQLPVGDTLQTEVETEDSRAELIQLRVIRQSQEGLGLAFVYG